MKATKLSYENLLQLLPVPIRGGYVEYVPPT